MRRASFSRIRNYKSYFFLNQLVDSENEEGLVKWTVKFIIIACSDDQVTINCHKFSEIKYPIYKPFVYIRSKFSHLLEDF